MFAHCYKRLAAKDTSSGIKAVCQSSRDITTHTLDDMLQHSL